MLLALHNRERRDFTSLNRSAALFVAIVFAVGPYAAIAQANFASNSLDIQVYADGSAYISQRLSVNQGATSVSVQLLSSVLSGMVVTDANGAPLEFQISGTNITVYTLGASKVTLRYDSLNLTSKVGTVWTIKFATAYNTTLTLPKYSTLTYISGTPNSLTVADASPMATLPPGAWVVSYGAAIGGITTTTNSTSSQGGGILPATLPLEWVLGAAVVAVVAAVGVVLWKRRTGPGQTGADLRPDDVQVLNFIAEKGGKVLESEIRTRFVLPKTSGWRQIKRLERLGYVRVTRIGSQNQIELVKNREPGA